MSSRQSLAACHNLHLNILSSNNSGNRLYHLANTILQVENWWARHFLSVIYLQMALALITILWMKISDIWNPFRPSVKNTFLCELSLTNFTVLTGGDTHSSVGSPRKKSFCVWALAQFSEASPGSNIRNLSGTRAIILSHSLNVNEEGSGNLSKYQCSYNSWYQQWNL